MSARTRRQVWSEHGGRHGGRGGDAVPTHDAPHEAHCTRRWLAAGGGGELGAADDDGRRGPTARARPKARPKATRPKATRPKAARPKAARPKARWTGPHAEDTPWWQVTRIRGDGLRHGGMSAAVQIRGDYYMYVTSATLPACETGRVGLGRACFGAAVGSESEWLSAIGVAAQGRG